MEIVWIGSPNRARGREGFRPEAVVVHIAEGTLAWTDGWFLDPASKVSAHYGIGNLGEVHQYVGEADTAWHAGRRYKASWRLIRPQNPNLYTLGIEHEGYADSVWSEAMVDASVRLTSGMCNRWHIAPDRNHIVAHREIYARKTCPGTWIDLDWLVSEVRRAISGGKIYNFVSASGRVRTSVDLEIRRGAPTTIVRSLRTAAKGTVLHYVAWTSNGLNLHGNPHWYKDDDGNFFWAGGTEAPVPGVSHSNIKRT